MRRAIGLLAALGMAAWAGAVSHAGEIAGPARQEAGLGGETVGELREKAKAEPGNAMIRMRLGKKLAEAGKNEEALVAFLWCFDHGLEQEPSFVGVRGSFMLSDVETFGRAYPPALEALRERRATAAAKVLGGPGERLLVMDVVDITRALRDDFDLMPLLGKLPEDAVIERRIVLKQVAQGFRDRKKYRELGESGVVELTLKQWEGAKTRMKALPPPPRGQPPEVRMTDLQVEHHELTAVLVPCYEALVAIQDPRAAAVKRAVWEIWPGKVSQEDLAEAEERAGKWMRSGR